MARFKDDRYFLLGTTPTEADKDINTSKPPTHKQILLSFLPRKDENHDSTRKYLYWIAEDTLLDRKLVEHYEKLDCKLKSVRSRIEDLLNLYEEMRKLMKIPKKRRHNSPSAIQAIKEFKQKLETTMVLCTLNKCYRFYNVE